MPSTVKNVYELGFIDPYQTTNKDQNKWFKDIVLGNIEAYDEKLAEYNAANEAAAARQNDPWGIGIGQPSSGGATSGLGVASGLGSSNITGAPRPPKYYFWLVNDLLKQTGETDPLTAWRSLSADEKDKLVADVGTRAMKDENSGSFLGNLLIKPTTPLSLIGPFNAIPGAAAGSAVAGVGITASGGIGTVLSDPLIGELGTGIITGGSGAGTLGGGSTEKPDYPEPPKEEPPPTDEKETWWEKRGYPTREAAVADGWRWRDGKLEKVDPVEEEETPIVAPDATDPQPDRVDPPPIVNVPGVTPGEVPSEGEEEENPPVVVPGGNDPPPTPDPPSNPFDAAIGNMGIFHGQAGASRKPYVNVKPPGEQDAPTIEHSELVQSALNEAGVPSRGTSQRQRPAQGLGIVEGVLPQKTPQNESEDESMLSKIRRRRRGLGIG